MKKQHRLTGLLMVFLASGIIFAGLQQAHAQTDAMDNSVNPGSDTTGMPTDSSRPGWSGSSGSGTTTRSTDDRGTLGIPGNNPGEQTDVPANPRSGMPNIPQNDTLNDSNTDAPNVRSSSVRGYW